MFMKTNLYEKTIQIIIFLSMTLLLLSSNIWSDVINKITAVSLLILLIIVFTTGKIRQLPKSIVTPITISVTAYLIMYTISLFYATTGLFALNMFTYYLQGIIVFIFTIILVNKNQNSTRSLLYLLSSTVAIGSIFSIDSATTRILTKGLEVIMQGLLGIEQLGLGGFEAGVRMTSIVGNPNVFASLAAFGTLAAAYLFLSSSNSRDQRISCGLLILNAVSFLYCFSLGALMGIFFAIIVLIILVGKEMRFSIVYLIISTIFSAFLSVFLGFTGMGKSSAIGLLPLASIIIFGVLLFFLLRYMDTVKQKFTLLSAVKTRVALLIPLLVIVVGIGAALTLSDSYTFTEASGTLRRSTTLAPGSYHLAIEGAESSNEIAVLIESQNYGQASTHTSSPLYQGALNTEMNFTVPDDAKICFINITAPVGTTIDKIHITTPNGTRVSSIKPDYLLLPGFMANRLQGILVNQNAVQRLIFFEDGIKIAKSSPIIGHGPGAFESKVLSVQDYYYETKSPHNHYIQTLDEVGMIGLAAFLSVFICCILALAKNIRSVKDRKLFSVLAAMLIMIIIHTALEVTFVFGVYNMAAFMIYGLISANFGQKQELSTDMSKTASTKTNSKNVSMKGKSATQTLPCSVIYISITVCLLIFTIYAGQFFALQSVKSVNSQANPTNFLDALEKGMVMDFTNSPSYKTTYLTNYDPSFPESYYTKSQKYARDLVAYDSFEALTYVVNYYLELGENEKGYEALNARQVLKRYDADAWNETFDLYRNHVLIAEESSALTDLIPVMKEYAIAAYHQLQTDLETSPLDITLSDENLQFIETIL